MRKAMLALFLNRQHLDWNMPRRRIELQVAEDGPAQHVRKKHIERDGRRQILPCQRQRRLTPVGDDAFEAFIPRKTEKNAGVMRIVVNDQQGAVAFVNVMPVVGDEFLRFSSERGQHRLRFGDRRTRRCGRWARGARVFER